jgi:hypothetical protein
MNLRKCLFIALAAAAFIVPALIVAFVGFPPPKAIEPAVVVTVGDESSPLAVTYTYRRPDGTMLRQLLRYHNRDTGTALFNEEGKERSLDVLYADGTQRGYYRFGEHGTEEGLMRRDDRSLAWRSEKLSADVIRTSTWWVGGLQLFSVETVDYKDNTVHSVFYRRDGTKWIDRQGARYGGSNVETVYDEQGLVAYSVEVDGNTKRITYHERGIRRFTQVWVTMHYSDGPGESWTEIVLSGIEVYKPDGSSVDYKLGTNRQQTAPAVDSMQVQHADGTSTKSMIDKDGVIIAVVNFDKANVITERREIPEPLRQRFQHDLRYLAAQPERIDPIPIWLAAEPDKVLVTRRPS